MRGIPGIARHAKMADDRASAVSELMQVQFAQQHSPGRLESLHDGCVVLRNVILQHRAGRSGFYTCGFNQIFNCQRNAMQRAFPGAVSDFCFSFAGRIHGRVGSDGDESIQLRIQAFNLRETCLRQLHRRDGALLNKFAGFGEVELDQIAHGSSLVKDI